jgi:hypothetical protein
MGRSSLLVVVVLAVLVASAFTFVFANPLASVAVVAGAGLLVLVWPTVERVWGSRGGTPPR